MATPRTSETAETRRVSSAVVKRSLRFVRRLVYRFGKTRLCRMGREGQSNPCPIDRRNPSPRGLMGFAKKELNPSYEFSDRIRTVEMASEPPNMSRNLTRHD